MTAGGSQVPLIASSDPTTKPQAPIQPRSGPKAPALTILILHLLLYALTVYAVGVLLRWWSRQADAHGNAILFMGLTTIIVTTGLLVLALLGGIRGPVPFLAHSLDQLSKYGDRWVPVAIVIFFIFVSYHLCHFIGEILRLRQIKASSWGDLMGEQALSTGDETLVDWEGMRLGLQEWVRDETRNERVVLRWSARIQLPFTVGVKHPNIYIPLWILRKESEAPVEQLLAHECEHILARHHFWIRILRLLYVLLPFVGPTLRAVRHAFEAESDRCLINKLDEDARKQYIDTLESVIAPASGSGLEVGLGHDRRNIPLRIKQAFSKPVMRWDFVFGSVFAVSVYCYAALSLGGVNSTWIKERFNRTIPANYAIVDKAVGAKITPIAGSGGDISAGLNIDTTSCDPSGRVVVGIGRSDARYDYDPWEGFEGSALIEIKRTGGNNSKYPILAGTGYQYEFYSEVAIIANVVDKDLAIIDKNARYVATISKASSPGDVSSAMNWEIVVPSGWRVRLTDVRFRPYSGPRRPVNQVLEKQKMHRDLAPLGKADFDQTWDLKGRPFFAD